MICKNNNEVKLVRTTSEEYPGIVFLAIVFLIICGFIYLGYYKFSECRKFEHTFIYCLLDLN